MTRIHDRLSLNKKKAWLPCLIGALFVVGCGVVILTRPVYYDGRTLDAWIDIAGGSDDPELRKKAFSVLEQVLMRADERPSARRRALEGLWKVEPWRTLPFHFELLKRRPYDPADVPYEWAKIWEIYEMKLEGRAKVIVPFLVENLSYVDLECYEREIKVRQWAIIFLGRLGRDALDAVPALRAAAVKDPDESIRRHARWALSAIRASLPVEERWDNEG